MADGPSDPLRALQAALGHTFANPALLREALSHASLHDGGPGESYQRLEFVGDRVLGLSIAAALYQADPTADEGELARRLNGLVRREACADRALALGIDRALRLGAAEAQTGGRRKSAILADACEAVLAAVYLDAGFATADAVVRAVWAPLLADSAAAERDGKTALQELLQARGEGPPTYQLVTREGPDHKPHFVIAVVGEGGELARGDGGSKREAEQVAARAALSALGS